MRTQERAVLELAAAQHGVVTTAQAVAWVDDALVDRRVGEGRWQRLHRGVLVPHNGPVPWLTRAKAAVLHCGPDAVLSHASAGWLLGLIQPAPQQIEVSVAHERRIMSTSQVRVHRRRTTPVGRGDPPRTALVPTLVDLLAEARSPDEAIGLLTDAARLGAQAWRVRREVAARVTMPGRAMVLDLLGVVAQGVESPLEHRYHRDVEARHGLPRSTLQVRDRVGGMAIRSDRRYEEWGVRIELDGVAVHSGTRADDDVWRDNAVLLDRDEITLRYRWRHVLAPCRTAAQVGAVLRSRGWRGELRRCGPTCTAR